MRERWRVARLALGLVWRAGRWRAAAVLALNLLLTVAATMVAWFMKLMADAAVDGDLTRALVAAGGLAAQIVFALIATWTSYSMRMRVDEEARRLFDDELMRLASAIPTLEAYEEPKLVDRLDLLREHNTVLTDAVWGLYGNINLVVQSVGTALLLVSVHPALLALPLFALPSIAMGGRAERQRQNALEATAEAQRTLAHVFDVATTPAGGKEVRTFRLAPTLRARHDELWGRSSRTIGRAEWLGALWHSAAWVLFSIGYVGAIVFVAQRATAGAATVGDVLLTIVLTARVQTDVTGATATATYLTQTLRSAARYLWLVDLAADHRDDHPITPLPDHLTHGVTFENVGFTYEGRDEPALDDVDLVLPAGSVVALVGENGAGKTTLVKLLLRLYEPTRGRLLLDGIDLRALDVDELRAGAAATFQDFLQPEVLASQAIGLGDLTNIADDTIVADALDRAGAPDLMAQLPQRGDTQLGRSWDGVDLSGGQWQKIAVGRGMMRSTPLLLILDEPTAALDPQTEYELFRRFSRAATQARDRRGAITVIVSHRFSTVRMADLIVVLANGRIAEVGAHDDLMKRGGLYAELFALQASAYS